MESSSIDKNYMEELKISPTKPVLDDYAGLFALKYDMILGKLEKNDLPIGNRTVMLVNIEKIVEKVKNFVWAKSVKIKTTSDQNKTPMISPISKFTKITHNKTPLITFPIAKFTTKTTQNTTPRMISPFTKFTTKIKETITTTNHATSTRPDCLLKYHPAEYNGYGCLCCEKHDKCQTLLKNKCSSTIDNPFDIFSISLFASNYKWKCEGGGSTIQCLDNDDECQKLFCNCDKILIECLSQHTKPKQRQPCWSNINETIKEATRKPIEAVESIKFDVVKAKEDVKKFSNAGRNFDKKKAREAIDAAVKASKDFLSVTKKIHEENDKKLKKAESDFKAAVEKARKSKSFDDWKAADQAMAQVGITIMEIETVGRKIDEVIKIGLESAKEVHYLAIRMEDG
uniref:Phospholipase A(2) n=1 Tax=Meloidogyne hapla TaxID=6305 RepID=A0A1I8BY37_MELHA